MTEKTGLEESYRSHDAQVEAIFSVTQRHVMMNAFAFSRELYEAEARGAARERQRIAAAMDAEERG